MSSLTSLRHYALPLEAILNTAPPFCPCCDKELQGGTPELTPVSGNTSALSSLPQILAQEASVTGPSVCPAGTQDSGKKGTPLEYTWVMPHLAVVAQRSRGCCLLPGRTDDFRFPLKAQASPASSSMRPHTSSRQTWLLRNPVSTVWGSSSHRCCSHLTQRWKLRHGAETGFPKVP